MMREFEKHSLLEDSYIGKRPIDWWRSFRKVLKTQQDSPTHVGVILH